jgi:RHS repeat-associated protein
MGYDDAARLSGVTNARGYEIEAYGYDDGDRIVERTDAKSKSTTYSYDSAGRLLSMSDRRGATTTYTYDALDRVVTVTRPEGVTRFTYDAVGRLSEIADSVGSISYRYDAVDRLVKEIQVAGGLTTEVAYAYDALDRRISRVVNGSSTETTTYAYDLTNRLKSISYRGQVTSYEYDTAGRLAVKVLPNGIRQAWTLDEASRVTEIRYTHPDGSLIEAIGYGYDAAGRRVSQSRAVGPLPETPFTATYDEADRMTSITLTDTGKTYALTYGDNGNLVEKRNVADAGDLTLYSWDSRNRLTGITAPGVVATFEYDVLNRRVARTVNGAAVRYLYDGIQALGEIRGKQQYMLLTGLSIDEAIARYPESGVRTYLTDHVGSVFAQSADDGSFVNHYEYSSYGQVASASNDEGNNLEYTGRENDETGLYYYRARYYDPLLKRFASEDPLGYGDREFNLHAYVAGNPISTVDPLGLFGSSDLPSLPQSWVDFSAGMGDVILFGQGRRMRELLDIGSVDHCSGAYDAGEWAGIAATLATGIAGGIRAAGAKGAGQEFSHWIPNRMGGPRSLSNGNYVPTRVHALSDPYRYRFMPRAWKATNPLPSRLNQQWVRIPNVYKGGGAGGAYGAAGGTINGCTCPR